MQNKYVFCSEYFNDIGLKKKLKISVLKIVVYVPIVETKKNIN